MAAMLDARRLLEIFKAHKYMAAPASQNDPAIMSLHVVEDESPIHEANANMADGSGMGSF